VKIIDVMALGAVNVGMVVEDPERSSHLSRHISTRPCRRSRHWKRYERMPPSRAARARSRVSLVWLSCWSTVANKDGYRQERCENRDKYPTERVSIPSMPFQHLNMMRVMATLTSLAVCRRRN